jgi:hypothetical protein
MCLACCCGETVVLGLGGHLGDKLPRFGVFLVSSWCDFGVETRTIGAICLGVGDPAG